MRIDFLVLSVVLSLALAPVRTNAADFDELPDWILKGPAESCPAAHVCGVGSVWGSSAAAYFEALAEIARTMGSQIKQDVRGRVTETRTTSKLVLRQGISCDTFHVKIETTGGALRDAPTPIERVSSLQQIRPAAREVVFETTARSIYTAPATESNPTLTSEVESRVECTASDATELSAFFIRLPILKSSKTSDGVENVLVALKKSDIVE